MKQILLSVLLLSNASLGASLGAFDMLTNETQAVISTESTFETDHVGVTDLTPENFQSFLSQDKVVVIDFCSRSSGICAYMDFEWELLAREAKLAGKEIAMGRVDCQEYTMMCNRQSVGDVPTLRWKDSAQAINSSGSTLYRDLMNRDAKLMAAPSVSARSFSR